MTRSSTQKCFNVVRHEPKNGIGNVNQYINDYCLIKNTYKQKMQNVKSINFSISIESHLLTKPIVILFVK